MTEHTSAEVPSYKEWMDWWTKVEYCIEEYGTRKHKPVKVKSRTPCPFCGCCTWKVYYFVGNLARSDDDLDAMRLIKRGSIDSEICYKSRNDIQFLEECDNCKAVMSV
jgi:hypothetical protein